MLYWTFQEVTFSDFVIDYDVIMDHDVTTDISGAHIPVTSLRNVIITIDHDVIMDISGANIPVMS